MVIESGTIRSVAYDFLLVFYSNIVPKMITAISTRGIENFGEVETSMLLRYSTSKMP